jgi:glycosyltransferase involved in cell wall biosynthesis
MNILFLNSIHEEIWGGGEKWMTTTAEGLRDKNHTIWIGGRKGSIFLTKASNLGFSTFPIKFGSDFSIPAILKLAKFFSGKKIDFVLVNFTKEAKLTGLAAKISSNPLVVPMHGLPILTDKWMDRIIFTNLIEGIIVNTSAFKNQYVTYDWVDDDYVRVIHNGLEVNIPVNFVKQQTQKQFSLPRTYPVIGIFGRLTKQKQHHLFLEAARKILDKLPDAAFLIVGEGPEREQIEKYSKKLGIDEHVHLLGMQKEVYKLYHYCDLVLLTSAYEGIPNVLIESMLMETPLVAFDVGGVVDAIPNRDLGIVVPQGDTQKMAEEAVFLLDDENRLKATGQKARLSVQEKFPMQKMVDETDEYIKELVHKRSTK